MATDFFIAVDLGTTNTVMAYGRRNFNKSFGTEIIKIEQLDGNDNLKTDELLPSVLYKDHEGNLFVGLKAKQMKSLQSSRTISNSKRFMGTDQLFFIDNQEISPSMVAAEILKTCRIAASEQLNREEEEIEAITITVPASFSPSQVEDTILAAEAAGFIREKVMILTEPTAALLDYINTQSQRDSSDWDINFSETKRILVFDIGGGTCDVAVIDVTQNEENFDFTEKALSRYEDLGGTDFDIQTANYLFNQFLDEYHIDPGKLNTAQKKTIQDRLVVFAEIAKERISGKVKAAVNRGTNVDFLDNISYYENLIDFYDGEDIRFELTKKEFDTATHNLYHKPPRPIMNQRERERYKNFEEPIIQTLSQYNIPTESIDYVFMTGGMSKYIEVQNRVREILNKPLIFPSDEMSCVAVGAAVFHYYTIETKKTHGTKNASNTNNMGPIIKPILNEVLAEAIMIDINEGLPRVIVPANNRLPMKGVLNGVLKTTSPGGLTVNIFAGRDEYDSEMRIQKAHEVRFNLAVPTGTSLDIEYDINTNKALQMWLIVNGSTSQRIALKMQSDVKLISDIPE